MKRIIPYLILAIMIVAACNGRQTETAKPEPIDTVPVMITQIRKCARLYTAEYRVHKIVTHDDEVKLKGSFLGRNLNLNVPFSSRQIAIPVDATLNAYIDFGSFNEANVVRHGDNIEIILPDPKVEMTSSRINHDDIRRQVALLRSNFTDKELSGYESQGRAAILASVPKTGILDMAREGAAHVLVPMITRLGYKEENITVTFRKNFTMSDLPMILEKTDIENGGKQ